MTEDDEELPQEDERGTEPPADGDGDEEHGPIGNPATDEEALSQRQQEGEGEPGDDPDD